MNNLIAVIQSIDPRFVIGWALLWFGLGIVTVALMWAREKTREVKRLLHIIRTEVGHVMTVCYHEKDEEMHTQCICGETSLMYKMDDPTAPSLMERWEEHHIDSQMESAGR